MAPPPAILIAGATGNTGVSVVETLSNSIKNSSFSSHRILATTRSAKGTTATRLAQLPGVEVIEQNWVEITPKWLSANNVVRAFIASNVDPRQFAEESIFQLALLEAGVEYVVRISTTACNVRPDCKAFYPRNHWAIEALLASPEFSGLQWTSLQPNNFFAYVIGGAVELVKKVRAGGEQDTLRTILSEDAPIGVIDPSDVGAFAARLLLEEDASRHNGAKYVLNGPEDLTGRQLVELTEKHLGAPLAKEASFKDVSFLDPLLAATPESKNILGSIKWAPFWCWDGRASASTTSEVVLEMSPPKITAAQAFEAILEAA